MKLCRVVGRGCKSKWSGFSGCPIQYLDPGFLNPDIIYLALSGYIAVILTV